MLRRLEIRTNRLGKRLVDNCLNINALIGNYGAGIVLCEGNIEMSHVEGS